MGEFVVVIPRREGQVAWLPQHSLGCIRPCLKTQKYQKGGRACGEVGGQLISVPGQPGLNEFQASQRNDSEVRQTPSWNKTNQNNNNNKKGVVVHAFDPNTEGETGCELIDVSSRPVCSTNRVQDSQGYIQKTCLGGEKIKKLHSKIKAGKIQHSYRMLA